AIASGWLFFFASRVPNSTWPSLVAVITSIYLTLSLPTFFIEFSTVGWIVSHPWVSAYVKPWANWGLLLIVLAVVGSCFGRARARISFAAGSILLLTVRL